MIANDVRCRRAIRSRIVVVKAAFNKQTLFTSKLVLYTRKELVQIAVFGTYLFIVLKFGHYEK